MDLYSIVLDSRRSELVKKLNSFSSDSCYPLIAFPNNLVSQFEKSISTTNLLTYCQNKEGNLACLQPLKEPSKPTKPRLDRVPTSHFETRKESFWCSMNGIIIIFWVVLAFLCGGLPGLIDDGLKEGLLKMVIAMVLGLPFLIVLLIQIGEKRQSVTKEIQYTNKEIETLKKEAERRYDEALEQYPDKLKLYEEELKLYEKAKSEQRVLLQLHTPSYLSFQLKSLFSASCHFIQVDNPPPKGRSEDILFASLMSIIPDSVHIDTAISGYYPDIMVSTKNKVYLDIEIDEPYEMDTKKEIHYIGGEDEIRNERITKKGWVVVRFSEKQVMTNCSSCTQVIEHLIAVIEKGDLQALDEITSIRSSIKDKRWRKEDARMMSINNYRKSY